MNQPEYDPNMYEKILSNFDTFCDQFEGAAARRFAGLDNDSRQPIDNATVQRANSKSLQKRLTMVEKKVSLLERPQLMYKPPQCQNYKTIAETLDDLHNAVEELRDAETVRDANPAMLDTVNTGHGWKIGSNIVSSYTYLECSVA